MSDASEKTSKAKSKKKKASPAKESRKAVKETKRKSTRSPFKIADVVIKPGKRAKTELPIGNLVSGTPVALPLIIVHGKKPGPVLWLSAAIHGDEICGVEIIRQVLATVNATQMAGTIIAAPVVNVHGFNNNERYMPDRRDLNRSFPGSARGSLASRIANLFMKEVVHRSDVGIDLHTGSDLRTNLAQVRCDISDAATLELARNFGAPIVIGARLREGSLRRASGLAGKVSLLFEGGEASRFDPDAIRYGTQGVLRTLNKLDMTEIEVPEAKASLLSEKTSWGRASRSGIVHLDADLGELVSAGQRLATIYDPFGKTLGRIKARFDGLVIGHTQAPLVNRGDAISHIAKVLDAEVLDAKVSEKTPEPAPLNDLD